MQPDQSVFEMVEEVLACQAKSLAHQSSQPFERALEDVGGYRSWPTAEGFGQNGEHRYEMARHWQANILRDRAEERLMHLFASEALSRFVAERSYSWLEGCMEWLEGKEAHAQYQALLEEELASLGG